MAGAGRITNFVNIERLEVNAAGGDDLIYILSTSDEIELIVRGGSGNDTIHIGGDHPTILFNPPSYTYQPPEYVVTLPPEIRIETATWDLDPVSFKSSWWHNAYYGWWDSYHIAWYAAYSKIASWYNEQQEKNPYFSIVSVNGDTTKTSFWDIVFTAANSIDWNYSWGRWWHWWDPYFTYSYDIPEVEFTYGVPEDPKQITVTPPAIELDPPPFAFKDYAVDNLTNRFNGSLEIDGGDLFEYGSGDMVVLHNENGSTNTGTLGRNGDGLLELSGFGVGNGLDIDPDAFDDEAASGATITFDNVEDMDIYLSNNVDTINVDATVDGTTNIVLGGGSDIANIKGVNGVTNFYGGAGDDTFKIFDTALESYNIEQNLNIFADRDFQEDLDVLQFDSSDSVHTGALSSALVYIKYCQGWKRNFVQ